MAVSALIVGVSGLVLTHDEQAFLKDCNPWGLILFRRNIHTPQQVLALTQSFRACVGRTDAPVLSIRRGDACNVSVRRIGPLNPRARPMAVLHSKIWPRAARLSVWVRG